MNNKLISIVVVIILIIGGFWVFRNSTQAPTDTSAENGMPVPGSQAEEKKVVEETRPAPTVKEFSVDASSFEYAPFLMQVNNGDTVKITVKNTSGMHNLKIDEFNVSTRVLAVGESQVITFVANRTGTFEYYCSVDSHRGKGMVGKLIVR